jgi:Tol biopolymer transport system component
MKTWKTFIVPILFVLTTVSTACTPPMAATAANATPTIVRLSQAELAAVSQTEASEAAPTETASAQPLTETATATSAPIAGAQPPFGTATTETATPTANATSAAAEVQAEVVSDGLNLREGPGISYAVVGTVDKGAMLEVTGASAGGAWLRVVTAGGASGWVSGKEAYTRVVGSLSDVPLVEATSGSSSKLAVTQVSYASGGQSATAGSQTATATTTAGGKLVFATQSGGDLYVANADGSGLLKLASGVIDPAVSPDGTQVAFTRWDGAEMGTLVVINIDGSGERVVLGETLQAKSPTWSPDGQSIIVSFQHGGVRNPQEECRYYDSDDHPNLPGNIRITKMDRDSDGSMTICFIHIEDLQWGLRRVDVASGQFEDLAADLYSYNPAWDPINSWRVIYSAEKGLMQLDLTTGQHQSLTDDGGDTGPVFSPDGQTLALTYQQHDHWEVYTYNLASGSRQRLTKPSILADPQYSSASPAWSPDGSQIAFVTDRTGQWEIWVMNADGSNPHALFSSEVQAQLGLDYQGMNEKLLNWIN